LGHFDQEVVLDAQVIVNTVEECLAEGPALEAMDNLAEQLRAGGDVQLGGKLRVPAGQQEESALEKIYLVKAQQGEALLAEKDLVLQE
jgi:hypothetical protein